MTNTATFLSYLLKQVGSSLNLSPEIYHQEHTINMLIRYDSNQALEMSYSDAAMCGRSANFAAQRLGEDLNQIAMFTGRKESPVWC